MHNPLDMRVLERGRDLHEVFPDGFLGDETFLFLEVFYHLG